MTSFPGSPKLAKAGLVLVDPISAALLRVIPLQYNPETLTRTLQVRGTTGEAGDRTEALRLTGPPIETIKLDAEIDAADQLEFPDQNPTTGEVGLHAHLAALETIVYPASSELQANDRLSRGGTLEILPMEAPLSLFVWSKSRVLPVRLTDFSITEEAFDTQLNPILAKVSLGMTVLSVNDLLFDHRWAGIFMAYQRQKESLAAREKNAPLSVLGITRIP
jgi:hypothetical protein